VASRVSCSSGHSANNMFPLPKVVNPVEHITSQEATETLRRLDPMLPTEAQAEYANRGSTVKTYRKYSDGEPPDRLDWVCDFVMRRQTLPNHPTLSSNHDCPSLLSALW